MQRDRGTHGVQRLAAVRQIQREGVAALAIFLLTFTVVPIR